MFTNVHLAWTLSAFYCLQISFSIALLASLNEPLPRNLYKGLDIYKRAVGGGRIQNIMTKILNPPLRARENILTPLTCKMKKF